VSELWSSIQALWIADWVSLLIRAAVFWAFWYGIAVGIAHLLFGRGGEAVDAAVNGMYFWLSIPVSISLGVLAFAIPMILTLALGSRARA
jgi:hypothetical protein